MKIAHESPVSIFDIVQLETNYDYCLAHLYEEIDYYKELFLESKKKGREDLYLLTKLTEETGEVAKEIRRKADGEPMEKDLTKELGDLLWCITAIAEHNNIKLSTVFEQNLEKLEERNLL